MKFFSPRFEYGIIDRGFKFGDLDGPNQLITTAALSFTVIDSNFSKYSFIDSNRSEKN